MDYDIIAEGVGTDTAALANAEAQLKEGSEAELRLYVENAPSPEVLRALESDLLARGVMLTGSIVYDSGIIVVRFVKTTPPAPAEATAIGFVQFLPLILGGIALIGVVVFAWQLGSKAGSALSNPLLIFAAVAVGIVVWFTMRPQKAKEAQET